MKKGQVSTEILVLVGLMLVLLLPLLLYSYGRANVAKEDISVQKAEFAAQRLASAVDSVGYLGGAAALVDEVEIPPYVKQFRVNGHEVIFEIDSASGKKEIVKSTAFVIKPVGISDIKKSGTYFIEIRALSNFTGGISDQVEMCLNRC